MPVFTSRDANACSVLEEPATAPDLEVRVTPDGDIDLERLERTADLPKIKNWIRLRLAGQNIYWPINHREMEPPHDIFVTLWQRSGPRGLIRSYIEESVYELIQEARLTNPPWRKELLQLVRIIRPARCLPILESVLHQRHSFSAEQIQEGADNDWLLAAAAYQAGSLHSEWLKILEMPDPRHSTIAYRALAQDWSLALRYLPAFTIALRPEDRPLLVRSAVRSAFERCGSPALFSDRVEQNWALYGQTSGLQDIVAGALASLKLPIPRTQSPEVTTHPMPNPPRPAASYAQAAARHA